MPGGSAIPNRPFRSRASRVSVPAALLVLLLAAAGTDAASTDPVAVLTETGRRELTPMVRGDVELVPVSALVSGLGLTVAPDPKGASLALRFGGREVTLYQGKSLASVGGDLRLLSSNVLLEGGQWLVPLESVPRILGPLLGKRVDYRAPQRVLVLGNVRVPRVDVTTSVSGQAVRVVLTASETVPFRVARDGNRVTVSVERDLVDVGHQPERLTGGIVDLVQFTGGKGNVFAVTLGRRFHAMEQQEQGNALVLDFLAASTVAEGASPDPNVPTPPPPSAPAPGASAPTVVIDPGHGGTEVGATGPSGSLEKDVTLSIARKLRSALMSSLGVQAFLTRDRDQDLALDDRAAFANNYKADLFVSIHANASRSQGARGSEVYFLSYQATDDESRRIAAAEGGALPAAPEGGGASDLSLILWDMAQAEHLEESSALASRVQEELAAVTGSETRGVKQAPFRVLVGAAMPAILVEVAFISNAEEEKLLTSDAYQNRVVGALLKGIARYRSERQQRLGAVSGTGGPRS